MSDETVLPDMQDQEKVAGFWQGLLHGSLASIRFIVSLFNKNVHMYDRHNNGGWYDLGFLLGVAITMGGSRGGPAVKRPDKLE